MALDLRQTISDELCFPVPEVLIPNESLQLYYREVGKLYFNYRRGIKGFANIVVSGGSYDFSSAPEIPEFIVTICDTDTNTTVPEKDWSYTKPILTIADGNYSVIYYKPVGETDVDEFPSYLYQELWVARCKKGIGQRMKFSKFGEQTFDLDGEALYQEGDERYEDRRAFLIENRDELEFPPEP